jgi:lipopolysaccharide biosynthesis glycosyltransferase
MNRSYNIDSMTENKISIPEISAPPIYDNAYVWLLMKGDPYLPGIITSVYSVLRTNPEADLVVMITPDISEQTIEKILTVASHIFYIPYLRFETVPLKTEAQQKIYKDWASDSYTKWNMLALPYKKAIFMDADVICTTNIDHLFKLQTPAAPFNSPFEKPLGHINNYIRSKKGRDGYPKHGSIITPQEVKNMLYKGGITFTATTVVLSPDLDDYRAYIEMVLNNQPYGAKQNCHSVVDERSLSEYYSIIKKYNWTNIHQKYNYIGWKNGFMEPYQMPLIIHYFSPQKPWNMKYNEYPDVISWYKMAGDALKYTKLMPTDIHLLDKNIDMSKKEQDTYIKQFTKNRKIMSILDIKDNDIELE